MTQYNISELALNEFRFILEKGKVCTIEFLVLSNLTNISFRNAPDYYSFSPKMNQKMKLSNEIREAIF